MLTFIALVLGPETSKAQPVRVECERPHQLRLVQYEDRSGRVYCGRRVILRIGVPW